MWAQVIQQTDSHRVCDLSPVSELYEAGRWENSVCKMKIFDKDGKPLGLFDVCRWWIEEYPSDVFVYSPEDIIEIRKQMEKMLKARDEFVR